MCIYTTSLTKSLTKGGEFCLEDCFLRYLLGWRNEPPTRVQIYPAIGGDPAQSKGSNLGQEEAEDGRWEMQSGCEKLF